MTNYKNPAFAGNILIQEKYSNPKLVHLYTTVGTSPKTLSEWGKIVDTDYQVPTGRVAKVVFITSIIGMVTTGDRLFHNNVTDNAGSSTVIFSEPGTGSVRPTYVTSNEIQAGEFIERAATTTSDLIDCTIIEFDAT